jgi:hypothetical protein
MQRAFVDVLLCRACGGRLRLIATIVDPGTIRGMLRALGLATEAADRAPPSACPVDTGDRSDLISHTIPIH